MLLVVEDDPLAVRLIHEVLGSREYVVARSAGAALIALDDGHTWTGAVIDIGLPEGLDAGLAVLRTIRAHERFRRIPCMALTGQFDRELADRTSELGAHYILKPPTVAKLQDFLDRTDRRRQRTQVALVDQASSRYGLSRRQAELLGWLLEGRTLKSFCVHAGIEYRTLKDHRRELLAKTGDETLEALVSRILLDALNLGQ